MSTNTCAIYLVRELIEIRVYRVAFEFKSINHRPRHTQYVGLPPAYPLEIYKIFSLFSLLFSFFTNDFWSCTYGWRRRALYVANEPGRPSAILR